MDSVNEFLPSTGLMFGVGNACEPSRPMVDGIDLTLCAGDFRAKESVPGTIGRKDLTILGLAYGSSLPEYSAFFDHDTQSWRTCQRLLSGDLEEFSATFPRSGTMRNGRLYQRTPLPLLINETAFSLWPTCQASDCKRMKFSKQAHLKQQKRNRRLGFGSGPASANIVLHCRIEYGGVPTANFCEWLMGLPIGWSDIAD
jgi:hypothetical protein